MKNKHSLTSLVTLGNAGELVVSIAENVIGGEVGETFAGSLLSREMILQLAQTNFQKKVNTELGE